VISRAPAGRTRRRPVQLTWLAQAPGKVRAVVGRKHGANDCQDAPEEPVVDPQATHVSAWEWVEVNGPHSVCHPAGLMSFLDVAL
jgi:hypothetical protein